jgi:C4-dicarboxylate-specific signal transduction histidine kinase
LAKDDAPRGPEKELHPQADKLLSAFIERYRHATLGRLLQGVLHNLNGALQILSMQMELLERMAVRQEGGVSPEIQDQIAKCLEQLDQFQVILDVLLQKGMHDDQSEHQMVSLNELLEEELAILHHNLFFKHQIRIQKALAPSLPLLKGSHVHFSQGLFPLIENAIEAMADSEHKALTIITGLRENRIQVQIKDTGCGIPKGVQANLFRPFFTTKAGNHHGLGLYVARALLTPYGASFHWSSEGGETVFEVSFPCSPANSNH